MGIMNARASRGFPMGGSWNFLDLVTAFQRGSTSFLSYIFFALPHNFIKRMYVQNKLKI